MVRLGDQTGDSSDKTATVAVDRASPDGRRPGADALAIGDRVGDYIICAEIARGGCGVVYRAEHRMLGRISALKVLHSDLSASAEMTERFVREARAVNRIGHPNIVDIYDIGALPDQRPYLVMTYLEGVSAREFLRVHGRLENADLLALFAPLCAALRASHEAGIVHRDVKASNVMVRAGPAIAHVTLVDFGLAKLLEPSANGFVTSRGRVIGTPQNMAPEQILGQAIDARTDVYALGVLLFQMLTGRLPFAGVARELLREQHLTGTPPRASAHAPVSPAFDDVIARAMAKEPADRFADVASFLAALESAARGPVSRVTETRPAAAILVRARMEHARDASGAHSRFDDLQAMLEDAEDWLVGAGLSVPVATQDMLLGVFVGERDQAESRVARPVVAHACALAALLAEHELAGPDIRFSIQVRAGALDMDTRATGARPALAGALLDPRTFREPRFDGLVHAPADLMHGLEHARLAPGSG